MNRAYMSFEEYERELTKARERAKLEDMSDPHCETMEELNEWAKKHGCMNYIFELNFARIMSKKRSQK